MTKIDADLKMKASAYNSIKGNLQTLERKSTYVSSFFFSGRPGDGRCISVCDSLSRHQGEPADRAMAGRVMVVVSACVTHSPVTRGSQLTEQWPPGDGRCISVCDSLSRHQGEPADRAMAGRVMVVVSACVTHSPITRGSQLTEQWPAG